MDVDLSARSRYPLDINEKGVWQQAKNFDAGILPFYPIWP